MQDKAKRQGFTPQVPQVASAKGEKMPVLEITDADIIMFIINTPIRRMTVRQLKAVASYERVKLSRDIRRAAAPSNRSLRMSV